MRFLLGTLIPTPFSFPLATLTINLVGSFGLGLFYAIADKNHFPIWLRLGIGTGVIGAFTTFSTFSFEMSELLHGHLILSVLYGVASIGGGVLSVAAGERSVRPVLHREIKSEKAEGAYL
ncbi:MAG: CrcB family protein [Alicyclobacillus shizuokensis]|nr:CrcB family protein [Alicyclobacillus shizuokensis]